MNGIEVSHVKNSAFKKILKPQKGVLKLHIVRTVDDDKYDSNPALLSNSTSDSRCRSSSTSKSNYSRSSSEISNDIGPEAVVVDREAYRPASCGSGYSSRSSSNYRSNNSSRSHTREGSGNVDDSPTRLKGGFYSPPNIHAERPSRDNHCLVETYDHQVSQDSTETGYSAAMPTKLVPSSQESLCASSCSSHSGSRVHFADTEPLKECEYGYDTNNNSNKMFPAFSSSQAESVSLSFHSQSVISHNHLTVETTQTLTGSDDDEAYNLAPFARDDVHRTTVRTRSMSSLSDNRNSLLLSNGYQAESEHSQCSQVSQPTYGRPRAFSNYRRKQCYLHMYIIVLLSCYITMHCNSVVVSIHANSHCVNMYII